MSDVDSILRSMKDDMIYTPHSPPNLNEIEALIDQFNEFNAISLRIEDRVLNCGLKAFDFDDAVVSMKCVILEMQLLQVKLAGKLEGKHYGSAQIKELSEAVEAYFMCSVVTSSMMREIASGLAAKANGGKFGFFKYRRMLKEYEKSRKARAFLAGALDYKCNENQ